MASIEVSLSTAPRRRKSGSLGGKREISKEQQDPSRVQNVKDKDNTVQNIKDQLIEVKRCPQIPLTEAERSQAEETSSGLLKEVDAKRASIKNLKLSLDRLDITDNIDTRIQQAELEYQLGREELELLTLLEQSRALQLLLEQDDHAKTKQDQQTIFSCVNESEVVTLHAIQVEYDAKGPQFGAGHRQRYQGLWVEWALEHTGMRKGDRLLEVNGKLVLSKSKEDMLRLLTISPSPAQIVLLRTTSDVIIPQDNLKHLMNGHSNIGKVDTLRNELDALREQADETKRSKESLRSDNLRLTHRISYLEEQVAELLERNKAQNVDTKFNPTPNMMTSTVKMQRNVTNISITSEPNPKLQTPGKTDIQVFQKGPDVTALVANLPGLEIGSKETVEAGANLPVIRPRSSQSNVSSTHIECTQKSTPCKGHYSASEHSDGRAKLYPHVQLNHVHNHRVKSGRFSLQPSRSSDFLSQGEEDADSNLEKKHYALRQSMSHHSIYNSKKNFDYNSETSAALEIIKNNERQYAEMNSRNYKDKKLKLLNDNGSETSAIRNHEKHNYDINSKEILKLLKNIENSNKNIAADKRISESISSKDEYSDFNPERDYRDHRIDGKMIQNAHKSNRRLSKIQSRNGKSQDCDSEPTKAIKDDKYKKSRTKLIDYTSEPNGIVDGYTKRNGQYLDRPRPLPPKKPVRLSLHRAQSMQTIEPEASHGDKFYLHNPTERSKLSYNPRNQEELRYSIAKTAIDDMVNYDKENKVKDYDNYAEESQYSGHRLRSHSKEYSRSEEVIECGVSLSDRGRSGENKRIKKRPHDTRSTTNDELSIYSNGSRNKEYNSSKSESLSSSSMIYGKYNNSQHAEVVTNNKHEEYQKVNNGHYNGGGTKYNSMNGDVNKSSNSIVSSFKWSSPSIFKNIRIDGGSSRGHGSNNSEIVKK